MKGQGAGESLERPHQELTKRVSAHLGNCHFVCYKVFWATYLWSWFFSLAVQERIRNFAESTLCSPYSWKYRQALATLGFVIARTDVYLNIGRGHPSELVVLYSELP